MERDLRDPAWWMLPLAGGLAALLVAALDGLFCGLGADAAAILGLRACIAGLALGLIQTAVRRASRDRRIVAKAAGALVVAPWSIWVGLHLSRTATLRAALPGALALVLPIAVLLLLGWAALALHGRLLARGRRSLLALAGLPLAVVLVALGPQLADLHGPLAISCSLGAWLCLELALLPPLCRLPSGSVQPLALAAVALALVSPLLPLPLADAFQAADRSAVLRPLVRSGRTQRVPLPVASAEATAVAEPATASTAEVLDEADLPRAAGRSVVLISIDALRADRLGTFGYERPITPSLDAFAATGIAFSRAYAAAPTSSFSIPALLAGQPMEAVLRAGAPLPATLADRLRAAGFRTIGLYPPKVFSAGPELMRRLERTAFGFETSVTLTMEARADARDVRRALSAEPGRPVFLWAHFNDPHLPYECHGAPFGAAPADCYDAEIRHVDAEIGRLLPWLVEQLDDPVVAITADHGEAFGEHGRLYHSADLHDEQIRVPLLIRVPGVAPRRVDTPVSLADLPATLLALAAGDAAATCPGHDLRPLMIAEVRHPPVTAAIRDRRAIVEQQHKLICSDWPGGPCALYDLGADPGETRNLIAERASAAQRLRTELERLDRIAVEQMTGALPRPIVLGRLGRADAAPELIALARDAGSPQAAAAAQALAMLRRPELAEPLSALHGSSDDRVAAWAGVGSVLLGEAGPPERLAPYAREPSELGRWCAVALGRLGDPRSLKPLIASLRHDDPRLRAESALALGELGDRRAVAPLLRLLEVKQSRWAAIEGLGRLGDPRAAPALERLRGSDPDETNLPRYDRALLRILGP